MSAKEIIVLGPQGEPILVPRSMCIVGPQNEFIALRDSDPDQSWEEKSQEK